MKNLKPWLEAVRLRTIPVSVAGVLSAWACNITDGNFNAVPAVLCLVFAILCQVASNFANEYYDYKAGRDRKGRVGPRRGVTEGDIAPRQMAIAVYVTLAVAAVIGLAIAWWGGWWLIAAGVIIGLGALAYSTGPFPLSTHCLGEVSVFFFFGIIPVALTYYVQAHTVTANVLMVAASIGLMGANVLVVNNYRDIADDLAVGKHTLPSVLGRKWSMILYGFNAVAAAVLLYPALDIVARRAVPLLLIYVIVSIVAARKMYAQEGSALNPWLGRTAKLMLLMSAAFLILAIVHCMIWQFRFPG